MKGNINIQYVRRPNNVTTLAASVDNKFVNAALAADSQDETGKSFHLAFEIKDKAHRILTQFSDSVTPVADMSPDIKRDEFILMVFETIGKHIGNLKGNADLKKWYENSVANRSIFELLD